MSFHDTQRADEVTLRDRITIKADSGEWITGKVIELALLGDDMMDVQITILLDNETILRFDRAPSAPILYASDHITHPEKN